jgi:ribosomal protein S18 acetylase RimI-like enzyme
MKKVSLVPVKTEERILLLDYLLMADESEEIVKQYINDGEMFSIGYEDKVAGVVLFCFHPNNTVELKNIAFAEQYRGMGLGKIAIKQAFTLYQSTGMQKMIVGTANSSIDNIAFYQKLGFRMAEIKRDFFKAYPTPIFENGIRALDMIVFEKEL